MQMSYFLLAQMKLYFTELNVCGSYAGEKGAASLSRLRFSFFRFEQEHFSNILLMQNVRIRTLFHT